MRDARMMASWVLALFLAAMYLWIADLSLFPASGAKNIVFPLLAEKSEYYLFEPTGRYAVGLLHVATALLVILPWSRRVGAILAFLIAGGAVAAQLVWIGMAIPTETGGKTTDGGQLFYLTLALAAAALLLAFVHPGKSQDAAGQGAGYYNR
jgi:hypothetical protein